VTSLPAALTLVAGYVAAAALAVAGSAAPTTSADGHRRTIGYGQTRFDGAGPEKWAAWYRREHARLLEARADLERMRRVLLADPNVVEAINLACATYGYCSTLWRKARCETGGTFDPRSHNPSSGAAGLMQFLPSTWATTPFGRFSIWSPYANALAAGWMHAQGRGGEWECR
jgi:hypothetical protein